jgi:hypothetical protein
LKEGAIDFLSEDEIVFWQEFIPQYLKPIEGDKEHEKQVSHRLPYPLLNCRFHIGFD